ncbi:hypothetical protein FGO68_gene17358 [Halteria grandinella]|uniref:MORN repeat protein n=1 Tax=Halteria grandinella TaxID=5974 RepID=A0A8J8T5A5_HALGN|nr:hypothetical protein FGO68_gene17358 [Halteria grandinella]
MEGGGTSINNFIQEKQQLCACNRGLKIRYYCDQVNCEQHRNSLFLCDDCYDDITGGIHKTPPQITKLIKEIQSKWHELIEKEGSLHQIVSTKFNPLKKVYEHLENQSLRQNGISGRPVFKDVARFERFHQEFRQEISRYEEYSQKQDVAKLVSLQLKYKALNDAIDSEFSYLTEICKPDFIFENYQSCIQNCPTPKESENALVIEQILALKVRLGEQNMSSLSTQKDPPANPQELEDVVNHLREVVNLQGAKINAFYSIFGGLQDAATLVSRSFISQGDQVQVKAEDFKEFREEYDQRLQILESKAIASNTDFQLKIAEQQKLIQESMQKNNDLSLKLEVEIQKLHQRDNNENILKERQVQENLKNIETQIRSLEVKMIQEIQTSKEKKSPPAEAKLEETKFDPRLYSIEQMERRMTQRIESRSSLIEQANQINQILASKAQQIIQQPVLELPKTEAVSSDQQPAKVHELSSFQLPLQMAVLAPPLFKSEMLGKLIQAFNSQLNGYQPKLNDQGQSKLTQYILDKGWNWSLQQLNKIALNIPRQAEWTAFEGAKRENGWSELKAGIYYGQLNLQGKREGYGIVYCTSSNDQPWLYECQWKQGCPINDGRYIQILDNKFKIFKGTLDESYGLTGKGIMIKEDGEIFEGDWQKGKQHGQGKITEQNGSYREGKWSNGKKQEGTFKNYNKDGIRKDRAQAVQFSNFKSTWNSDFC